MYDKLMTKLDKKGKKLNPLEKKAKMDVVKSLSSQAGEMLGKKVKSMKEKAGKSSEGNDTFEKYEKKAAELTGATIGEEGRDPEKLVEESEEELGRDLDNDNEDGESADHKSKVFADDLEDCSDEELEEEIQKLIELKNKRQAKKEE